MELEGLAVIARLLSTTTRAANVGSWGVDHVTLRASLQWPWCGATVNRGVDGHPPRASLELKGVDALIRETRDPASTERRPRRAEDGSVVVECVRDVFDDAPVNLWTFRRRAADAELAPTVERLAARLIEFAAAAPRRGSTARAPPG